MQIICVPSSSRLEAPDDLCPPTARLAFTMDRFDENPGIDGYAFVVAESGRSEDEPNRSVTMMEFTVGFHPEVVVM